MFSVKDDTVLDPFIGTGTTSLAAIAAGRSSIGYELEPQFSSTIEQMILSESNLHLINNTIRKRILDHKEFVNRRIKEKGSGSIKYHNDWFNFPVMTKQEKDMSLQFVRSIEKAGSCVFKSRYIQEALLDYQGSDRIS